MKYVQKTTSLVVLSETGSGKSTQIPQFIYKAGLANDGAIAITQPRRVAAISIATRVAKEMKCQVGDLVGCVDRCININGWLFHIRHCAKMSVNSCSYTVRFENTTSKKTKLRFMTDGSLLREALVDKMLTNYSVVILDEAHERTINTDVLFGIVKKAQKKRRISNMPPLKVRLIDCGQRVGRV